MGYKGECCEYCILIPEMEPVKLVYQSGEPGYGVTYCPMCKEVYGIHFCPYIPFEFVKVSNP